MTKLQLFVFLYLNKNSAICHFGKYNDVANEITERAL